MEKDLTIIENTAVSGIIENTPKTGIHSYYENISGYMEIHPEAKEKVKHKVAERNYMAKLAHDEIVESVNLEREISDFLFSQKSEQTALNYSNAIKDFAKYCNEEKLDPLRIKRKETEKFVKYLCEKFAPNSVRTKIMSLSSFYEYLIYHHENLFHLNYFKHLKLPNSVPAKQPDVVTKEEVKVLRGEFKRIKRKDFVCLIDIIVEHGIRIGTFKKMKIDENGNWQSVSKGSSLHGKFTKKEKKQIEGSGICELSTSTISNIFKKYTKKLYKDGRISKPFSPHDLRHFYIEKKAENMKIPDFVRFSRGIHKNIATTFGYINKW